MYLYLFILNKNYDTNEALPRAFWNFSNYTINTERAKLSHAK